MKDYKYILEPYRPGGRNRYTCPNCNKHKVFTRYIDRESGEYLAEYVGKCNRADNCNYNYTPGNYFQDNPSPKKLLKVPLMNSKSIKTVSKSIISIPRDYFIQSRVQYDKNNLICYLLKHFNTRTVTELISKYHIGTSDFWPGSTVFWLIDVYGKILGGQVVQFDADSGSTVKTKGKDSSARRHTLPVYYTIKKTLQAQKQEIPDWLAKYEAHAEKFPIPFGLHLIKTKPSHVIGLVEAPKTAIICNAFYPRFTWMAIGSLSYLNAERLKELRNYPIVLFPDASDTGKAFSLWEQKAQELHKLGFQAKVSDLLEKMVISSQVKAGMDMADVIIQANKPAEDQLDNHFFQYDIEFKGIWESFQGS